MSSLMRCINVTARCATLRRSEQLFPVGLTGGQHTYVLNICRNPGITQDQLAKMIYINKSNVARQVAQLEQAGFIERRVDTRSMGFMAEITSKRETNVGELLRQVLPQDFIKYGMIPEFIGRLPVIFTLQGLTKEMLVKILREPKNAIIAQYQKLLALDEVELTFDEEALEAIAERAMEKKTGARALRAILEEVMLDIMYEIPKDDSIGSVRITRGYIENTGGPVITLRNTPVPLLGSVR